MDYFELLRYRKSTRRYTDEQLSPEDLSAILLAANAAPVGSNMYKDLHLTVVQDRSVLDQLSVAAAKRWADQSKMKEIWGGEYKPVEEQAKKVYDPFHGAPTVIFVSHRQQDVQPGIEFSNVACVAYSMHLAAAALKLGSVFMWFVLECMRDMPEFDRTDLLNLPDHFEPLIGIAVGHPATPVLPRERTANKMSVNYV
ncbi:MAG: nitroreductase family protein [Oscillospiraceae bacterium]|nr:nitroreductase family protein [Oscillospiraceae bacterium]